MADFYTEMCFLKVVRQMKDTREEDTVSHKNTNQQNNNSSVPSAICPPEKAAVPIQDCSKLYETYSYVPSEEEEEIREARRNRKKSFLKLMAMALSIVLAVFFATIAWFTMNRETSAGGMSIKSKGRSFDLITLSDDNTYKNSVYYNPYHSAIRENETEGYDIWLVDSSSNINNYSASGNDDGTLGIEPGSSGTIKFYIKPYEDVTVSFSFQTIGYRAQTTTAGGQTTVTMVALSSAAGRPACFLNGHVLLFEHQDSTTHFYSGLIPTGSDGKRTFTRYFELNGSYDADTDGDGTNDAYEVEIHWIWPITLDTLVYNSASAATMLCDKDAVVGEGETNDYNRVVNNICTYPQYYLNGYSTTTTYTETMLVGRNAMYNDADQEIGMNIDYVLVRLDAEPASE